MADITNFDFSGGMNLYNGPLQLPENTSEWLINYELNRAGALRKRKGYTQNGSQYVSGKSIISMGTSHINDWVATKVSAGTSVTIYNGSAVWKTGDGADSVPFIRSFASTAFRVNGVDNMQANDAGSSGGWDYENCPESAVNLKPKYIEIANSRVYVANDSTSDNGGSRLFWSDPPKEDWSSPTLGSTDIQWNLTVNRGDGESFADIDPVRHDDITGLAVNADTLLVFKWGAFYTWNQAQRAATRIANVGALRQQAIVTNFDLGITYFGSIKGVYQYAPFSEGRPRHISRPVQDIWDAAVNKSTGVSLTTDLDHVYVSFGDSTNGDTSVTVRGRTLTNFMLVYNIPLDAWSIWEMAHPVATLGQWNDDALSVEDRDRPYFGDNDGNIYQLNAGSDDAGTAISYEWQSREMVMNYPRASKAEKVDIFSSERNSTQVFFDIDRQGDWQPLGELTKRTTSFETRREQKHQGNTVRLKVKGRNAGDHLLEGFNIQHEPLNERRHG